jgi:hypothetical protein
MQPVCSATRSRRPVLESLEDRCLLFAEFTQPFYVASEYAGSAMITLINFGTSTTKQVEVITSDGTAQAGVDYTSIDQVLTFQPTDSNMSVTIPLLINPQATVDRSVNLTLKNLPTGGSGPDVLQSSLIITNRTDIVPPRILDLNLTARGSAITGISVTFSKPMDPGSVQDIRNYFIYQTNNQNLYEVGGKSIPLKSAVYDPLSMTVTLKPRRPLQTSVLYEISLNAYGKSGTGQSTPSPVVDVAGNRVAGSLPQVPDGMFLAYFAQGSTLTLHENNSIDQPQPDTVATLQIRGGGVLQLFSRVFQDTQLRIIGKHAGRSVLTSNVRGGRGPESQFLGLGPIRFVSLHPFKNRFNGSQFLHSESG